MKGEEDRKTCPRCGVHEAVRLERMPLGHVHYGKRVCGNCGAFLGWQAKPEPVPGTGPSDAVLALVHRRNKPAPLRGTPSQLRFAHSLRHTLLFRAERAAAGILHAVATCVRDATWFIANQNKPLNAVRWPNPKQMEDPRPTGRCQVCGDPTYEGVRCCSDECNDEMAQRNATG
jgi:hypothetical protein